MTVYISENAELLPWTKPDWLRDAHAWIDERLRDLGLRRDDEITQVPLVNALAAWTSDVVAPLASDEECGWMLMRDAGVRLRELPARTDITMWKAIVRRYARLRRNVAAHVDTLLALGVRDLRLDGLATRFAELLSDEELLLLGRKGGLTRAEHRRLLEWQPELRDLCAKLSAYDIPETIEHNDLHSANVFLDGERPYFVDWGDASISHPFHTLRTTLAIVANTLETGTDDPSLLDVRDAYLSEFGDPVALKEPFELAQRTAAVTNVLTWAPFVQAMLPAFRKRYGRSIAEDARMILDVI